MYDTMEKKNLLSYKRKYHSFRHHAWAGLGFISICVVIIGIYPDSSKILTPIIFILIIYVVIALLFTYRYRRGLTAEENIIKTTPAPELEKERLKAEVEKEKLKLEKKKVKAEAKAIKKSKKE